MMREELLVAPRAHRWSDLLFQARGVLPRVFRALVVRALIAQQVSVLEGRTLVRYLDLVSVSRCRELVFHEPYEMTRSLAYERRSKPGATRPRGGFSERFGLRLFRCRVRPGATDNGVERCDFVGDCVNGGEVREVVFDPGAMRACSGSLWETTTTSWPEA